MKREHSYIIGALALAGAILLAEADTVKNGFVEVVGEGARANGDRDVVLHEPEDPSEVKVSTQAGWRFTDPQDAAFLHHVGATDLIHLVNESKESEATIKITDDWEHTCEKTNWEEHVSAPKLVVGGADHALILLKPDDVGVFLETNCTASAGEDGIHNVWTECKPCRHPDCRGRNPLKWMEEKKIHAPDQVEGTVRASGRIFVDPDRDDGYYLLEGPHELLYTASFDLEECAEHLCVGGAVTNTTWDVCRLSVTNTPYLGIDLTDEGKKTNAVGIAEARYGYRPKNTAASYYWEFISPRHGVIASQDDEKGTARLESARPAEPSDTYQGDQVICHATLTETNPPDGHNPCVASADVTSPVTVVRVDVEIEMPDATGEANEQAEEKYGAFVLYEKDYDEYNPFSPRAIDSLRKVKFTIEPELPADEIIDIAADKGFLYEKEIENNVTNYIEAASSYAYGELTNKTFVLHGHARSESVRDRKIEICHVLSGAKDRAKYTVVEMNLVPDFARDHEIDDEDDEKRVAEKQTFYWWLNDDADDGDSANHMADKGTELPGTGSLPKNNKDKKVNGRTDLLDFFPLWTKMGHALEFCRATKNAKDKRQRLSVRLRSEGIGYVTTRLRATEAGDYLTKEGEDVGKWFDFEFYHAGVCVESRKPFIDEYTDLIEDRSSDRGILLIEGRDSATDVALELVRDDAVVLSVPFNCKVTSVMDMINRLDLWGGNADYTEMKINDPTFGSAEIDVFYLHGFKVSQEYAKGWMSDAFKRLHQSGSNARFTGVAWPGKIEDEENSNPGRYYHRCAYNAFDTGRKLADFFNGRRNSGKLRTKTVVMAHSLGNMVVSAAIQDHGMRPTQYFLLNAAVASEAYFPELYNPRTGTSRHLVNYSWGHPDDKEKGFPEETYASNWYKLFKNDTTPAGKSRSKLHWAGRFGDVPNHTDMLNFSSSGDEVLEIYEGDLYLASGMKVTWGNFDDYKGFFNYIDLLDTDFSQYSWHKQEVFKGVIKPLNLMFDSNMAGWGFNDKNLWESAVKIRAVLKDGGGFLLKNNPVFRQSPHFVFSTDKTVLSADKINEMLTCAIPAISVNMGALVSNEGAAIGTFNMESLKDKWPSRRSYDERWLHCDLKDVAYYFNHGLWEKFVEKGGLK